MPDLPSGLLAFQKPSAKRVLELGAWISVAWYYFSHFELRLDNVVRREAQDPVSYALVAQLHLFL